MNKKILKILCVLNLVLFSTFSITGCNNGKKDGKTDDGKKDIKTVTVTTSFLNDMVTQIAKDKVKIETIIPAGEDPHVYVLKVEDHKKIESGDLILYHGLHFEGKMIDILEKKGQAVSRNFPKDKIGKMEEDGKEVIDPHFWFDISLYKNAVEVTAEELVKLVPEEKAFFEKNLKEYLQKLDDLDKYNKDQIAKIPKGSRYLITPHDAFNYFAKSYDIEVKAPQGVSTDSEVSISDITETVNFIVEHKVKAIFAESTTDPARMKTLQEAVSKKGFDVKVVSGEGKELFSDSLAPKGEKGDTYIDMYKHNIDLIVENLK